MDVLVVLGTTSAWVYGVVLMFMGHMEAHEMEMETDVNAEIAMGI
jgi:cation transport ATPase